MNEKINFQDLSALLAEKAMINKKEAEVFLREYFDVMNEELIKSRLLKIKDMGTFKLSRMEDRESIDVTTGERVLIPAHYKIVFTPDKKLAEIINEPFALYETIEIEDEPESKGVNLLSENGISDKPSTVESDDIIFEKGLALEEDDDIVFKEEQTFDDDDIIFEKELLDDDGVIFGKELLDDDDSVIFGKELLDDDDDIIFEKDLLDDDDDIIFEKDLLDDDDDVIFEKDLPPGDNNIIFEKGLTLGGSDSGIIFDKPIPDNDDDIFDDEPILDDDDDIFDDEPVPDEDDTIFDDELIVDDEEDDAIIDDESIPDDDDDEAIFDDEPTSDNNDATFDDESIPDDDDAIFGKAPITAYDDNAVFEQKPIVEKEEGGFEKDPMLEENKDWKVKTFCLNCHDYEAHRVYKKKYYVTWKKLNRMKAIVGILAVLLALALGYIVYLKYFEKRTPLTEQSLQPAAVSSPVLVGDTVSEIRGASTDSVVSVPPVSEVPADTVVSVPAVSKTTSGNVVSGEKFKKKESTLPTKASGKSGKSKQRKITRGQRLTLISLEEYGDKAFWIYIYMENKKIIPNPNDLPVGVKITIPPAEKYGIDRNSSASVQKAKDLAGRYH